MFVISVHTAEDGDSDGEGVQRAGGAFPDCHRRHEGNMKDHLLLCHLICDCNQCYTREIFRAGRLGKDPAVDPVASSQEMQTFLFCLSLYWRFSGIINLLIVQEGRRGGR